MNSVLTPQLLAKNSLKRAGYSPSPIARYYDGNDLIEFISREMIIPETGQPLVLHSEQADVLNAMSHQTNGVFDYSTWLYSAPKKSGKTTVAAGVALWQACRVPDGQVYIIGNDQKQADNRMMQAIRYAIDHNPRLQKHARLVRYTVYLDNGTKIESIPVDPRGEAGMNPTGLFWTEAWGAIGNRPKLLWSEAALSPTRAGQSFKFIESYAGYKDESLILERLYNSIIVNGKPHSSIPELFTNGSSIGYWCTRHIMDWQINNPEYYVQEERENAPSEFRRMHHNEWASTSDAFIPIEWWNACKVDKLPDMRPRQGMVLGVDAAVDSDYFAIVGVVVVNGKYQVRYCNVWKPPKGGKINLAEPAAEIERLRHLYNIECVAYDPMHLAYMAQQMGDNLFWYEVNQGHPRLVCDKYLYDCIRERMIEHDGTYDELRQHLAAADKKPDEDKLRIIKRSASQHIDAVIALSMAVERASFYNL